MGRRGFFRGGGGGGDVIFVCVLRKYIPSGVFSFFF